MHRLPNPPESRFSGWKVIFAGWIATLVATSSPHLSAQDLLQTPAEPRMTEVDGDLFPDLFVWRGTCNTYVLRDGPRALLIDIGNGEVARQLAPLGIEQIDWILFTSHHRELCQGMELPELSSRPVAASKTEQEILENPSAFRKWFPKLGDRYSVYGASYVRPPRKPIRVQRSLNDGDSLKWRSWEIQCIATPGNSPGGMTYLLRRGDKTLLVSGGLIHDGSKMTNWFDSEWDYGFGKGLDALVASVKKLITHEADWLLPSQGPLIRDAQVQLPEYLQKLESFRPDYLRGYQVFDAPESDRDSISRKTAVPLIHQVSPHLYKLSPRNNPGKNFAIIISDNGRGLILDAGLFPEQVLDEIILGMREHLGLKGIDAFWISHMHGDHFLLGPTLKKKYGAQAWTLDRIADKCEHPRRYDYAALVSAYGDGFDGMKIDRKFHDGESIEWEGFRIQVDWMPGQTEFGCCLWLEIDGKKVAFTGDNLFGNPAIKEQNGHEAVVARNSAIFEEGYLYGSRYLKDLAPDLVMGSHSNVMPDPQQFLLRYHDWSRRIIRRYRELLPDRDYEYQFDPYWVSAYPYRVDLTNSQQQEIRALEQRVQIERDSPNLVVARHEVLVPARQDKRMIL